MGQIFVKTNVYQAVKSAQENKEATPAQREAQIRTAVLADDIIDPQEDQLLDALNGKVDIVLKATLQQPLKVNASVVPFVDESQNTQETGADGVEAAPDPAPALSAILAGKGTMQSGQSGPAVQELIKLLNKAGYAVSDTLSYDEVQPKVADFQVKQGLLKANSPHLGKVGKQTLGALKQISEFGDYNTEKGQALAAFARRKTGGRNYSTKRCYEFVANAVDAKIGPFLSGGHAYLAANQLARNPKFKEIKVAAKDLSKLPAGAIVVWGKGDSKSGHISIADGKGNEISDFVGNQMKSHYGGGKPRVFLPL
jgi:hypothetical protein